MNEAILTILELYLNGEQLSEEQATALEQWRNQSVHNAEALELLSDKEFVKTAIRKRETYAGKQEENWIKLVQELEKREDSVISTQPVRSLHFLRRWGWVAAILILLAGGTYFLLQSRNQAPREVVKNIPINDIAPGKNGALLTLEDGSQVLLDSLGNGVIANQNGAKVMLKNGQVVYDATGNTNTEITYNTMTTPKGRQFQVMLPDGTQVWLNSASSIKYPTQFMGSARNVEITGEVYFEVAHLTPNPSPRGGEGKSTPFIVKVNDVAEIEVLGTHFNVNAYTDEESLYTTLLEGSVKVTADGSVIIKPGQQAQVLNGTNSPVKVIDDANIDKVMAWKNGLFNFEDAGLGEIMRQLSRWYNVEVVYEGSIPKVQFWGKISRNTALSDVLKALEESGIHFRIAEGNKLIVMP